MNTTENNILIAEFVELKTESAGYHSNGEYTTYCIKQFLEGVCWDTKVYVLENELKFHTSWDWLIPTLKQIKSSFDGIDVDIFGDYEDRIHAIEDAIFDNEIEIAYDNILALVSEYFVITGKKVYVIIEEELTLIDPMDEPTAEQLAEDDDIDDVKCRLVESYDESEEYTDNFVRTHRTRIVQLMQIGGLNPFDAIDTINHENKKK